jgi:hypothetical protein
MHMPLEEGRITIEDAQMVWRNFSGLPGRFNEEGDRNFNVFLDDETAKLLKKNGWNVRWLQPREEGEPERAILKVNVKYRRRDGSATRPPRVVMISSRGKTTLTEPTIPILDWAEIEKTDMILRGFEYEPGKVSAYLHSIYVTIRDDPLEMKYYDVPDSAASAIVEEPAGEGAPF